MFALRLKRTVVKRKKNDECSKWKVVHRMMNKHYITLTTSMNEVRDLHVVFFFFQLIVVFFNKNIYHFAIQFDQLSMLASFKTYFNMMLMTKSLF